MHDLIISRLSTFYIFFFLVRRTVIFKKISITSQNENDFESSSSEYPSHTQKKKKNTGK